MNLDFFTQFKINLTFFTFLFLIFDTIHCIVALPCPELSPKKGVSITCRHPETNNEIDCNSHSVPIGTIATYKCKKHFISPFGDEEGGRMTCLSSGWGRFSQYEEFVCRIDCGKPSVALLSASPVVVFGEVATREGFPWYTAIFRRDSIGEPFRFFCGGSLIYPSNQQFMVITAAHCVSNTLRSRKVRPVEDYRIVLGAVSSDFSANLGSNSTQIFTVKKAKIHPNYDYDRLQSDLGLMLLNTDPELSDVTLPVCFPNRDMANMEVKGTGMMAGFGVDETTRVSSRLNFARLPVTEPHVCNDALGKELTSIEFCAGYARGTSVCSGDSGGGLVFIDNLTKRLYLQGIASNVDLRALQELKFCQNYNTFTRVSSFIGWVYDTVNEWTCDYGCDAKHNSEISNDRPSFVTKPNVPQVAVSEESFRVTVYEDIKDKGKYSEWNMMKCSSLPNIWKVDRQFWVDVHGTCLQYFEGSYCSGRSIQLRPTSSSSIFRWSFPDYNMQSVSICQDNVPSSVSSNGGPDGSTVSGGTASGNSFVEGNEYEKAGLVKHNFYRRKHGTPQVRLSDKLNVQAKSRADELIQQKTLTASREGGENLFEITGLDDPSHLIVTQAVDLWYDTIRNYDWQQPRATSFSQVVWKATTEIGIGVARSGSRVIVVAKYSPPGNINYYGPNGDRAKLFRENVLRPR